MIVGCGKYKGSRAIVSKTGSDHCTVLVSGNKQVKNVSLKNVTLAVDSPARGRADFAPYRSPEG